MQKKTTILLAGLVVFGLLAGFGLAQAQPKKPNDCCKLRSAFSLDVAGDGNSETYNKGDVVGPETGTPWCDTNGDGEGDTIDVKNDQWGLICLIGTIYAITDWVFYLLTLVVVIMIIFGGFTIITATGDPEKAAKGRGILTYAIIGLAVALLAKLVPSLVKFIVGM